jgi:hypothetical protein
MQSTKCQPQPAQRQPRYVQLVDHCRDVFARTGRIPSYSMIRDALRISDDGSVRRYVKQAEQAGLISLAPYVGGRGERCGQRIRLGTPEEAAAGRKTIRLERDRQAAL